MLMCSRSQAKLLDYLAVHQVVAATTIDDGENMTIADDKEDVEQVVVLNLVRVINLCAQRSLHNDGSVMFRGMSAKDLLLTHLMIVVISYNVSCNNIFILNISTNIPTISNSDVGTFARTFLLHVSKSLAVVAPDVGGMQGRRGR
jgi:hypothetical protein